MSFIDRTLNPFSRWKLLDPKRFFIQLLFYKKKSLRGFEVDIKRLHTEFSCHLFVSIFFLIYAGIYQIAEFSGFVG